MDTSHLSNGTSATAEIPLPLPKPAVLAGAERRAKVRFPICLPVMYRVTAAKRNAVRTTSGTGVSVNVSSNGILFRSEVPSHPDLSIGTRLRINALWPLRLNGVVSLRLIAIGRVKRSCGSIIALSIEHYEFRTSSAKHEAAWKKLERPATETSLSQTVA